MRKILGKIRSKVGYPLLVIAMLITTIFGVFVSENFQTATTPITVPGGTASDGTPYNNYTYGTDSPVASGYGQDTAAFKRVIDNPYGTYIGRTFIEPSGVTIPQSNTSTEVKKMIDTGTGYLVGEATLNWDSSGAVIGLKEAIKKYDYNFNLINDNGYAQTVTEWLEHHFFDTTPNQSTYYSLTNDLQVATIRASDGVVTNLSSRVLFPADVGTHNFTPTGFTPSGWTGLSTVTHSGPGLSDHTYIHQMLSTGTIIDSKKLINPYGIKVTSLVNQQNIRLYELDNGNVFAIWREQDQGTLGTHGFYAGLSLYDSNFNLINSKVISDSEVVDQQKIEFLTTAANGNPIMQITHPTNGSKVVEYDKNTGMEVQSKSFATEQAHFSNVVALTTVSNNVSYYFIGNANGTGQFAGYTTNSGVVLAGLDVNFNVVSANFLDATVTHDFTKIQELTGDKLLVSGGTNSGGIYELFNQKHSGVVNDLGEGFVGTLDQQLDYAPKLKQPNAWNVVLDGNETAAQVDSKMLAAIATDMNGETNRYDDYTSNAELLSRINKNIYSNDYATDTIDWSLFGLTSTGTNKYAVGSNIVTYGVVDGQLNETVVSGRVNVCTSDTVTDTGDCTTSGAKIALDAHNFRVQKGTVSGINYVADASAKAWVLDTGVDETNNPSRLTWNTSAVQDQVGVYPVTYTYNSQGKTATKTIYVSVYDADTVSGPEDTTDITPPNMNNSELLHAQNVTLRVSEATGKTLDQITGVKAWNANTGTSVTYGSVVDKPYSSSNPQPDTYTIDYTTTKGTTKQVQVTIVAGTAPTISVTPAVISVAKDATLTSVQQVMSGVTANDAEDGNITSSITFTGTVNTATVGTHYIQYTVIDSDGNVANGLRAYTVGASSVGTDYAIYANNFTKNTTAVNTSHTAIISDSGAYAQQLSSIAMGTVQIDSLGGYTNVAGGYVIAMSVVEEPTTSTTVIANVIDTGVVGTAHAINADDITLYVSEATGKTPLQIFIADGMKAWNVTTAADVTSNVTTPTVSPSFNSAAPAPGVYNVTLSVGSGASQQQLTKTITILAGGAPSIAITPKQIVIPLHDPAPNLMTGVTASDLEDGNLTSSIITSGTVNTAVRGVYNITYSVTDSDNNTTTDTRTYIVGDNPVIGANYVLFADHFTEHVSNVNTADSAILAKANAEAFKLSDGSNVAVNVANKGGYTAAVGPYSITFEVALETTTTKTVIASVYDKGNPAAAEIVEIYDATLRKSEATGLSLQTITKAVAWNKTTGAPVALNITSTPTYTASNPAVDTYAVTATTTTAHGTTNTATVTITAGNAPVITVGNPVVQLAKDATLLPTVLANVSVSDVEDDAASLPISIGANKVDANIDMSTPGVYIVTYTAVDSDGNHAVPQTRTYVVGAHALTGSYAVFGNDFSIRVGLVDTITPDVQITNQAGLSAVLLADGVTAGTINITNNSGYTNAVANYPVSFEVAEDITSTGSITATVTNGNDPVLTVSPTVEQISLGASTPNIMTGVSANDVEDGVLTSSITTTGSVNTATPGVTVITYHVTDSDGNTATATRSYLVGAITVGTNYAIFGNDFSILKGQVNVAAKETQIRALSNITAQKISDGSTAAVSLLSDGGYTNVNGTYTPSFKVDAEAATTATITATVTSGTGPTLTITPTVEHLAVGDPIPNDAAIRTGVDAQDAEDGNITATITYTGTVNTGTAGVYVINYTVTDSDGNIATGSRSYLVGATTVGVNYAIFGHDFTIRTGQVDLSNKETQIRTQSTIKAQKISDGSSATITMTTDGGYTNIAGNYTANFTVDAEPSTAQGIIATVADGTAPTLTVTPNLIILNKGDATPNVMTSVSATDAEDGNITASILAVGSVNTAVPGTYVINYSVIDSDGNVATNSRSYLVAPLTVGTDYAIYANDFSILIGDVNIANKEGQIRTQSNVKAEKISDATPANVTMSTDGGYTNVAGSYTASFFVDAEPATTANIIATVGAGTMPTLTVSPAVIQVAKGGVKPTDTDIRTGVNANDVEDGNITTSISYTESINMAVEGVYIVTYSVTDSDNNTVTATRTYVVGGVIGTDYAIFGDDFTIRTGQVTVGSEETQIRTQTNIRAQKLSDGSAAPVTMTSNGGYTNVAGAYTTTFSIDAETSTTLQPIATVIAGNAPVMTVAPKQVQLAVGAPIPTDTDIRTGVSAADTEDGNLTAAITYTGSVDTSVAGTYVITYSVTDSDGNVTTNTRSYLVGALAVGTDYAIFGNNFTLRTGEVNTSGKEAQIRAESNIMAQKISDGSSATITMNNDGGYTNVAGAYTPNFSVNAEPATTTSITATITTGNNPVLAIVPNQVILTIGDPIPNDAAIRNGVSANDVEDGDISASVTYTGTVNPAIAGTYVINYSVTDSDGNVATGIRSYLVSPLVVGTNYAIYANDYTILTGAVDTTNKETQIRNLSNIKAEKLSDGSAATMTMITDGGYTNAVGNYNAAFRVDAEPATTGTVAITVSNGNAPTLTVTPTTITLAKDASAPNVMTGVSSLDTEDGNLTSSITNVGSVNTAVPGTYIITYSVTDSDGNIATATRSYLVAPLVVGTDYAIYGNDFTLRKGQVNMSAKETQIRTLADIKAEKISDATAATVSMTTDGGYTNIANNYTPTFIVDAEPATTVNITAAVTDGDNPTIIATPNQEILTLSAPALSPADIKNGVSANDTEDGNITAAITYTGSVNTAVAGTYIITYSVTDSDGNTATTTRSYLVAPLAVGTNYAIYGNDFSILTSAVDMSNKELQIRTLANIKAEKISDGTAATLDMVHDGGYTNVGGAYLPLFRVNAEPATTSTIIATVATGTPPAITVTPNVIQIAKDSTTPTDAEIRTGVLALDFEDGNITGDITYTSNINTAIEGVYIVAYSVTDSDGNLVHATRTYVVGGTLGADYAIFGDDFTIRVGQVVPNSEAQIRTLSNMKAQKLSDGSIANITMLTDGGYTNSIATYFPTFEVDAEPSLTHTIAADVVTGTAPIITVTPDIVSLNVGDTVPTLLAQMTGVVATDAEDGTITHLVNTSGIIDTANAGTYIVTYTVADSDGNTATATRSYLVGAIAIGTDYAIYGNDFTLRTGEVALGGEEAQIRLLSNIRAEKISDASAGNLIMNTADGYTNVADTYLPEFAVLEELTTTAIISATVIDGNVPVLTVNPDLVTLNLHDAVPTDTDIRTGVVATDVEDGNITSAITYTGSIDPTIAGTYVITYNIIDSDGNSATAIRSYLVAPIAVGTNHAIYGDNFTLRTGEVALGSEETQIRSLSNVRAERLSDAAAVTITMTTDGGYTNVASAYLPTFSVDAEPTLASPITATVVLGNKPVITTPSVESVPVGTPVNTANNVSATDVEDGNITSSIVIGGDTVDTSTEGVYHVTYDVTDSDGNAADTVTKVFVIGGVTGTDYAIFAHDFTKRVGEVNTNPAVIIADGQAYAVKLSDKTVEAVTVDNDGGYVATVGAYIINYAVVSETTTQIAITATVITGNVPTITTPSVESIQVGGTLDVMDGVSAADVEDGDITNNIIVGGDTVDPNTEGVYHITYDVTDSDGNVAPQETKIVVVGGVTGTNYAIFANDFTRRVAQVNTLDAAVIADGGAYAIKLDDKTPETVVVANQGGYAASVGTYNITYAVTSELATEITIIATVTTGDKPVITTPSIESVAVGASINTADNVTATDTEDGNVTGNIVIGGDFVDTSTEGVYHVTYDVIDSDGNHADTVTKVFVVGGVLGDEYAIFASNFSKYVSEVNTADSAIILAANAYAVKLADKSVVAVHIANKAGYTAAAGMYPIEFAVTSEPTTVITIKAYVVEGNRPVITDHTPAVALAIGDTVDVSADVEANDIEDGDITANIVIGGETVDTTKAGVYHVTYNVTDSDNNVADSVTRVYVVGGVLGKDYAIFANDFTKYTHEVDTQDHIIVAHAEAYAVKLSDKSAADVHVADKTTYDAVVGTHPIRFAVTNENDTEANINATVKETMYEYAINADDITVDVDVYNQVVAAGTLEAYLIEAANVHGENMTTHTELTPIILDYTSLTSVPEIVVGDTYQVIAMYMGTEEEMSESTSRDGMETLLAQTTFDVTITEDSGSQIITPDLPSTGEKIIETILLAGMILATSVVMLLITAYRKRKKLQ